MLLRLYSVQAVAPLEFVKHSLTFMRKAKCIAAIALLISVAFSPFSLVGRLLLG